MAASIEAIFSGGGDQIYPQTSVGAVNMEDGTTLDVYLKSLEKQISDKDGAASLASSITFNISYLATNTSDIQTIRGELANSDQWGENFQLPTVTSPYIWKRTKITFKGQTSDAEGQTFYEIVTADTAEISQTLYMSKDNSQQPTIKYPQIAKENDQGILVNTDNVNASLDEIITESNANNSNSWSKTPSEISAANPFGFMAVRTRLQGTWSKFAIALNAKWSYDSKIVIKYTVTSNSSTPTVNRAEQNPGSIWVDNNTSEFTGYLWMITATSSNNNLMADSDKNYWSIPQLISIVK